MSTGLINLRSECRHDGMIKTTQQITANEYNDKERIILITDYIEADSISDNSI